MIRRLLEAILLGVLIAIWALLLGNTPNPVVSFWITVSVLGLLISLQLTNESRLDLQALPANANGRRTAAWSRFAREAVRVSVHLLYLVAGLTVLGLLPLPRFIILPALVYGNIALVINSLIDTSTRRLLWETRGKESSIRH